LVETTRLRAGAWSRFCRVKMVERLYGPGFVEDLLDLQREIGGRPVLILTDEMAVRPSRSTAIGSPAHSGSSFPLTTW